MRIPLISEELAEETGWHIGDGSMNFYKKDGKQKGVYQLRGHIEDDREHYIFRIKPLFKQIYDIDISLREMPSTRVFGFQIWNDELVNFKKNLGLALGKKFDIFIPQIFLNDKKLKIAAVRGIFDTDGGIYLEPKNHKLYPRMYISTICPTLAKQLLRILSELGLRTTEYSQLSNEEFDRKREHIIVIRGEEMFHKFMRIINPQNPKHQAKYQKFLSSKKL